MPDSPKCSYCFERGLLSQTYKIAGKPAFKCQVCKQITQREGLDDRELLWKSDTDTWKEFISEKKKAVDGTIKRKLTKETNRVEAIVESNKK